MAMRATTMSQMAPINDSQELRDSDSMTRKVIVLLLLISASAVVISFLFKQQTGLPLLLSTFFADTSLGLIAGFGCRSLLYKSNLYVRSLVAIVLALIGMLMLGYLTNWVLGVGPLILDSQVVDQIQKITSQRNLFDQVSKVKIDWRTVIEFNKLDWADPVHLALSMLMAGLALDAWTIAPASEPVELAPLPAAAVAAPARRRGRRTASASNGRARVHLPETWFARLRPSPTPQRRTRSNGRARLPVQTEAKKVKEPVVHPKRRRSRRKPKIQFALVEEHRCPYCLDAVTHNDPRGVKECEVCHTLHHSDCWAITGVCQVPHLNT